MEEEMKQEQTYQPKPKRKMTKRTKKIVKRIGTYSAMSAPTLVVATVATCGVSGNIPDSWHTPEGLGAWIITAFLAGFLFTLWYPLSRLFAWLRTRTLKNKNLELEIEIKEKKLDALNGAGQFKDTDENN